MKDTFSNTDNCVKHYQNAKLIQVIADDELVGYVYGPHELMFDKYNYTYRIGGMNCCATSKSDAINKLIIALSSKDVSKIREPNDEAYYEKLRHTNAIHKKYKAELNKLHNEWNEMDWLEWQHEHERDEYWRNQIEF